MSAEFLALQCYADACGAFVVQQRTKAKRWTCRRCGAAQAYMRVFFASASAAQTRQAVMQLALARGERAEAAERARLARAAEREDARGAEEERRLYEAAYEAGLRLSAAAGLGRRPNDKLKRVNRCTFVASAIGRYRRTGPNC